MFESSEFMVVLLTDFIESLFLTFGPLFFFLQLLLQGVTKLKLEEPHPNPTIMAYRKLRKWTLPWVTLGICLTVIVRFLILMDSSYNYLEKKTHFEYFENIYIYFLMMSFVNICFFIFECITEEKLENNE